MGLNSRQIFKIVAAIALTVYIVVALPTMAMGPKIVMIVVFWAATAAGVYLRRTR